MAIICLDFDGTIHDPDNREPGYRMGKPVEGALEAVQYLLSQGHTLMIHSARVQSHPQRTHVNQWLDYFGFPKELECVVEKPLADIYVDDKGYRFTTWPLACRILGAL